MAKIFAAITKAGVEAVVMIPFFLMLDFCSIILFILSFYGIGIIFSWVFSGVVTIVLGAWRMTRGIANQAVGQLADKVAQAGGAGGQGSSPGAEVGKKAAKAGLKLGMSTLTFFIFLLAKFIPFLGGVIPSYTIGGVGTILSDFLD